jgi:hypothetical protein
MYLSNWEGALVMRRVAVLAGILLCVLQLSRNALTATGHLEAVSQDQEMNFTLEGKITEKTAGKLTVSTGENMIFHVLYNDKTQIKKKDGSPGTAQDLHTGLKISVAGDLAESGDITAKKIEIEGDGSEPKSAGDGRILNQSPAFSPFPAVSLERR